MEEKEIKKVRIDQDKAKKLRAFKLFIKSQKLQAAEKANQGAIPKVLNFIPSILDQGT